MKRNRAQTLLGLLLAGVILWVYSEILMGIAREAVTSSLWWHCLFVPFVSLWIWCRKRHEIEAVPASTSWLLGLFLVFLAVLLRLGEVGEGGGLFGGVSLVVGLAGIIALLEGRRRLGRSLFAVAFLLFGIPIPQAVFGVISFPMQNISSALTAGACRVMGLPVAREGVFMALGDFQVTVAAACSGLNSMFALFMCATWIIGSTRGLWWYRAAMLLLILPLVTIGNVIRLVVMMMVALFTNGDVALGFFHEGSDLIIFAFMACCLFSMKRLIEERTLSAQ